MSGPMVSSFHDLPFPPHTHLLWKAEVPSITWQTCQPQSTLRQEWTQPLQECVTQPQGGEVACLVLTLQMRKPKPQDYCENVLSYFTE